MQSWPVAKSVMVVSDPVMRSNGVGAVSKTKVSTPAPPVARFRLLCGDATVLADMQQHALGGHPPADRSWTDPPYNVAYQGGTAAKLTIANDALGAGFLDFLRPALANLLSVTKGACCVCMSSSKWPTLHRAWQEAGGKWPSTTSGPRILWRWAVPATTSRSRRCSTAGRLAHSTTGAARATRGMSGTVNAG